MRLQSFFEKFFSNQTFFLLLSILLHIFFLIIINYQMNIIYQSSTNDEDTILIDIIQNQNISRSKTSSIKNEVKENILEKKNDFLASTLQEDFTEPSNSISPQTSGWRTQHKTKRFETVIQDNLQARIGIEQSQRYMKIYSSLMAARERLALEELPIRCVIKLDDQLLRGNIVCNNPAFTGMIKNFLLSTGLDWLDEPQVAMKTCIPVAIKTTGEGLCY